ncbi:2-C-methyl-D-erythritol 4-phosphate cytidylyltransferase [Marinobacter sp. SS21]|uniref:2-C-methyl-D-erythritol 4-phosphate cytidylyltransferase n=1 Tax=Marinobacter sp. SS21 TaxID=2979460 RepID=UPI00232F2A90|nr:2-C-methyl-D-erythritol 4-phosphate cytidylyltransferase [Marinobacter sp. SS21]MDC0663892.1 2-C-methyl-D-erythritol 4-phosphate cytidylyltransferase [Marinobacter sp. SS21]
MNKPRFWLVIPAAGIGQRMQAGCPKQYLRIRGRYILDITVSRLLAFANFVDCADFAGCMIALHPDDECWANTETSGDRRVSSCTGGRERADSVQAALQALSGRADAGDWVLVHDVARPCVSREDLHRLLSSLADHPTGGLLAAPVTDTLKRVRRGGTNVDGTEDRSGLWRALTPQMFRYEALSRALRQAEANHQPVTDEASAMEMAGSTPQVVEGRPDNIKITVPADLALAEFILGQLDRNDHSH